MKSVREAKTLQPYIKSLNQKIKKDPPPKQQKTPTKQKKKPPNKLILIENIKYCQGISCGDVKGTVVDKKMN